MDERQRDTMLANFAISGGSKVAIAMGQVLAERDAAQAAADAGAEAVGAMAAKVSAVLEENDRLRAAVEGDRKRIWHGIESWVERGVALNADGTLTETEYTHKPLGPFFDELCALVFQLDGSEVADG